MATYKAPLDEIGFVLFDVLGYETAVRPLPGFGEAGADLVRPALEEAGRLCEEVLLPLNRGGDEEGCRFENGVVRTPDGFKAAYDAFAAGGWSGLALDPAHRGQGLPRTLHFAVMEMICSANLAFGIYPGLSHGAADALHLHGTEDQKALYLPRLASGEWTGTMCLTEPQCGTDLGLIRTKAVPDGEGAYSVTGTKIFISCGEHDLADNILHLVLAKLPDAPAGTRGISLFLVPKVLVGDDGSLSERNGVRCGGIENKMGIHASATCTMHFDEAKGFLVGGAHGGMKAMFTMMNAARLAVAIQGLGVAETACQTAVAYAKERRQGRALSGAKEPEAAADPIIVHPDVRRMLLTMRSQVDAARVLACWTGMELDAATRHPDPERRKRADDFVALMTPILKAHLTDLGTECANTAMQVLGGHGYVREWGVEQLVRDARIAQIYEGTNGIQALDLVGRKLPQGTGRLLRRFFHPLDAFIKEHEADPCLAPMTGALKKAAERLRGATLTIARKGLSDPEEAGAAASDYLRLFALTAMAWAHAKTVVAVLPRAGEPFGQRKIALATFYMTKVLPETGALFARIMAGKGPVMGLEAEAF
ncbi:MAG: acyl-CoA dehydrogenase C-terminal domain-containing protein [Geminicoccaceae bacterium]|nr:acyl-CoA dehydrogenase C-terminal domain-containing protein [Geminicoccaceae bacterium]